MKKTLLLAVVLVAAMGARGQQTYDKGFEIAKNLEIFANVYRNIHLHYVDDVDPGKTMKVAIDAMLASLDPYTNYYPESDMEDVKIQLMGEYGGIGALIGQRGDSIFITQPYEGKPADLAGLRAGDRIVAVNGESTAGKQSQDVSAAMRGQAGTEVTLTIERNGKTLTKTLTRREIKMKAVPYYGMVRDGIGYIKLNEFTANAATEVRNAFHELKAQPGLRGVILDLRGNGGGLLNEAVDIVNIFEPKGKLVVEQKGKVQSRNARHYTRMAAEDTVMPVAVLIDGSSASASEIVSGSLQDFDRAVIIGERSYGKGLVQNILPMDYNTQMKVTVSKYYIPSGRCIQALDYSHRNAEGKAERLPDSLRTAYRTAHGRTVYDGMGIEPDIEVAPEYISNLSVILLGRYYIFDWVNQFVNSHDTIAPATEFEVSDAMYDDFTRYLQDKDLSYNTATEAVLQELRKTAAEEHYIDNMEADIEALEARFKEEKARDLVTYKKEIKLMLKNEILARYYYERGQIAGLLNDDTDVAKAIEVLQDRERLNKILNK